MINHGRSLLLNVSGSRYQPQYLGEEYIPPDFVSVSLPSYLQTARRILFGARPDRVFLNYRVRDLLHSIHETELAEYLYALDSRVTYWPEPDPVFFNQRKYARIEQIAGPYGARLFMYGRLNADNATGSAYREYTVRVQQNDDTNIIVEYEDARIAPTVTQVDISSGLSSTAPIAGTDLRVRIGGTPIVTTKLVLETGYDLLTEALNGVSLESVVAEGETTPASVFNGSAWRVATFAPPSSAVAVVPVLEVMGEPNLLELFGVSNYDQPYATFKNLWFDHPLAVYRLAGFTMAMIYRTEEIRRGRNG